MSCYIRQKQRMHPSERCLLPTAYRLLITGHRFLTRRVNIGHYAERGKKVFEILPAIDWNKGKAIRWVMETLKISWDDASVVYIGDDVTDEDAFRVVRTRGTGILVSDSKMESSADFQLSSPDEVRQLFEKLISLSKKG